MRMRLPVTSSRRCEQITAFGASDVPEVKISAQIASMSGSMPRSAALCTGQRDVERRAERDVRIVVIGEAGGREDRWQVGGDRREQVVVPGFGDDQSAVRVLHVAQQMLAPAGVVEADDRGADERGAAEREEVVGRVVEQDRDVARTLARQPVREERREPARLLEVLGVRERAIAELDRGPVAVLACVAAEQRGRVRGDERSLPGRGNRARSQT